MKENNIDTADIIEADEDVSEDVVYNEIILNGYVRENKRLLEENRYLKEKMYTDKIRESKANFENPKARIKELEEQIEQLRKTVIAKDKELSGFGEKYAKADEIILDKEKEINRVVAFFTVSHQYC